jgi:hypothetical protein
LALFAAATTRKRLPGPGRFVVRKCPGAIARSRSMRLRNGLGRFSSSERSYSVGTGGAVFVVVQASVDSVREVVDFEGRDEDVNPVGSEADAGRVAVLRRGARRADPRMDGLRRRVGGTAFGSFDDEAEAVISGLVRSRFDGEGGKSASPSPFSASELSAPSSKSNILANSIFTFGDLTKSLTS